MNLVGEWELKIFKPLECKYFELSVSKKVLSNLYITGRIFTENQSAQLDFLTHFKKFKNIS